MMYIFEELAFLKLLWQNVRLSLIIAYIKILNIKHYVR